MVNVALVSFMVITIILLFFGMILSAVAASDAKKSTQDCKEGCHKNAMWSALISGISLFIIIIVLIIYIYTSRKHIIEAAKAAHAALKSS